MLKYLPSRRAEKTNLASPAASRSLEQSRAADKPRQQLRFVGNTGYCQEYSLDIKIGEILADYVTSSALPFSSRNPLFSVKQTQSIDFGPSMSRAESLALLNRMMSADDNQTIEQWEELKSNLNQNRTSDRKLFDE